MKRFLVIAMLSLFWLASAQCTTGATQLLGDGKFYGCVEGQWRKLTEDVASNEGIFGTIGNTQNINGVVHGRETNNVVSQLLNIGNSPINIADAPAHVVGKIYYSNSQKHFYQGVNGGLWHQIDNMVWSSTQTRAASGNFTRNNCGADYVGGTITYTPSSTASATSTISQADADTKAANQAYSQAVSLVSSNGQNYANSNASCTQIRWTSTRQASYTNNFTKNNCPAGYAGSIVSYSTPWFTATRTSTLNQADADTQAQNAANALALNDINTNGQNYANNNGTCIEKVYRISGNLTLYEYSTQRLKADGGVTYDLKSWSYNRNYTINIPQSVFGGVAPTTTAVATYINSNPAKLCELISFINQNDPVRAYPNGTYAVYSPGSYSANYYNMPCTYDRKYITQQGTVLWFPVYQAQAQDVVISNYISYP